MYFLSRLKAAILAILRERAWRLVLPSPLLMAAPFFCRRAGLMHYNIAHDTPTVRRNASVLDALVSDAGG